MKTALGVGLGLFIQLKQHSKEDRRGCRLRSEGKALFSYNPAALAEATGDVMPTFAPRF